MDHVFPFGLPLPTAFYTTLYVLTFALHQALMHYVLAGSLFVAWTLAFPGAGSVPRSERRPAAALRDWMPFMLSAAITAGVAPLLFVQILYRREFYTANLLLSWRWMIVIPALITAFYLLYLIKSSWMNDWPRWVRAGVGATASALFVFVGFCWTANYLLSISGSSWATVYASGTLPFGASTVVPRMLVWGGGAFASMAMIVAWQIVGPKKEANGRADPDSDVGADVHSLATIALGGLIVAFVGAAITFWRADANFRGLAFGIGGGPYVLAGLFGVLVQLSWWLLAWQQSSLDRKRLTVISAGWIISLASVSVVRELGRWSVLDAAAQLKHHQDAIAVGGLTIFLIFAVVNFGAIALCIWTVRRGTVESPRPSGK